MIDCKKESGKLTLQGELTIPHAGEFRSALSGLLKGEGNDCVSIHLEGVTEIDLSGLQLLCSAHRSAAKLKKRLTLSGVPQELFGQIMETSGYVRLKDCEIHGAEGCFWVKGDK